MKFGPIPAGKAEGAILAHSVRLAARSIRKGERLTAEHVNSLLAENVQEVICARLDAGDVHEDEAALNVATLVAGSGIHVEQPFTGRSNLFAERAGVFQVNESAVNQLNRIDQGLTLATLPAFAPVAAGRMVATAKIIPFALPREVIADANEQFAKTSVLDVVLFHPLRVGLIQTRLASLKPAVLDKTRGVTEQRLALAGASVIGERRVDHNSQAVVEALDQMIDGGAELILVFGASAIIDGADVIPSAIRSAGGVVDHFGVPVDPGNLLLTGKIRNVPVIGAPGCARSPRENGFDWVLNRLLAKIPVTDEDLTGMGVGGLLMEITSRPQLRQPAEPGAGVAAVVLAAGQSRRMGSGRNKLLAQFDGESLVRRSVRVALQSKAAPVIVVTGHMADQIRAELDGLEVVLVDNPDFAEGLSTSLKCGVRSLPDDCSGVLVMLADMPGIDAAAIDKLIAAFEPAAGRSIILPTSAGKRGNPVVWSRNFFADLLSLSGDVGARHLLAENDDAVHQVDIGTGVVIDVDTPDALAAAGGRFDDTAKTEM